MDFPIDFLTSPSILACVFDGNLLTKTAPKPNQTLAATVTTTYAYDVLHRLIEKSYNDGATATVKYGYDNIWPSGCTPPTMTITNPIGRRTSMCDAGGASAWTYDDRGRVVRERRKMNDVTNTKDVFYEYKHDNALWRITYPNTQFMTYSYDPAGRSVSLIEGTTNWLTDMTYHPHGAPSAYKLGVGLGGFAGYNNSFTYNSRLQPLTIAANIINGATILSRTYDFHLGTDNNGNVYKITNNLDGGTRPIGTVDYTYDQLNRIATAATTGTDCTVTPSGLTKNWGNSYEIDPWGNLNKKNVTKCSAEYLNEQVNEKNQFTGTNRYDAAGNLWENGTYTYDAENRLLTAGGVTYTYDGDGRRVKKSSGTLYWYDVNGNVLVETQADPAGTWLESHRYFGGKRILRHKVNGAVRYIFADNLGSASVVGNFNGAIMEELDFYPYGGTRVISSAESNAYKFTGKERDSESGLDYFGARMFGSPSGRFSSPDPDQASGFLYMDDPQAWNGYSYARNNPIIITDPTGEVYEYCTQDKEGKYTQCHTVSDDQHRADKRINTFKDGKIYDGDTQIGTYRWVDVDLPGDAEANRQAAAMIVQTVDTAMVEFGKNAAYAATGTVALRGLGALGSAATTNLNIFKNTKVVINFAGHRITSIRPRHLPPPGSPAEIQAAVEGAVQTGNYTMRAGGLIEGTTMIQGILVGFTGRMVNGVARIGTVFTRR